MNTVFDISKNEIKSGDHVHFACASSIDYVADDGPTAYALDYTQFKVCFDKSLDKLSVDRDFLLGFGYTIELLNHLDLMLHTGKATLCEAANQASTFSVSSGTPKTFDVAGYAELFGDDGSAS